MQNVVAPCAIRQARLTGRQALAKGGAKRRIGSNWIFLTIIINEFQRRGKCDRVLNLESGSV